MHNRQIQKIIVFFSVITLLFACSYGGLFFFINQKNQQTMEIYSSMNKKESESGSLSITKKSLDDSVSKRKTLETYFITEDQTVSFIEQIEQLGDYSQANVKINSVIPPVKKGENFLLSLSASGKFEDIYRLLNLIEKMPYRVTIGKVSLIKKENEIDIANQWIGSFTIYLESYVGK